MNERLFYDDEHEALAMMIGSSEKTFAECAHFLWPAMKPESAYAKLKRCVSVHGDEHLSFGQVVALMKFCGRYDPLYHACNMTLHARPDRKAPQDQEQRIVESIDHAAHTLQRAMQELQQFRRLRGAA